MNIYFSFNALTLSGQTLINLLAYVELNACRAKMVKKPEDYRWCSLGYHVQTGNKDGFLSLNFGLANVKTNNAQKRLRAYLKSQNYSIMNTSITRIKEYSWKVIRRKYYPGNYQNHYSFGVNLEFLNKCGQRL